MLDFRKVLLAAAVAGLGLVGTASAQVACTTFTNGTETAGGGAAAVATAPTGLRNEGITEQITPLVISGCTGTPNNTSMTLTLSLSVPLTNQQLTGQTTTTLADTVAIAQGFGGTAASLIASTGSIAPGSSSVSYTFTGLNTATSLSAFNAGITIYNLRVNVSALAANAAVTATASGSTALITPTTTPTVAYAQTSLASKAFNGFGSLALCNIATTDINVVGAVNFKEAINIGFATDVNEFAKETNEVSNAGLAYPAGAGVVPSGTEAAPGTATFTNPVTQATTIGTRVAVTFGNLASGVTYYIPSRVVGTTGTFEMDLISSATGPCLAPAAGCASLLASGTTYGTATNKGNIGPNGITGVYPFTPTTGSFTAYYAVVAENQTTIDGTSFASIFGGGATSTTALGVTGPFPSLELFVQTSATAVAAGVPTASIYLVGNTSGYSQFLVPSSPTVTSASASTENITLGQGAAFAAPILTDGTGGFNGCNTTMIFPYIINTGGYDTGIALTNAGLGTSVSGNPVTSTAAGVCTMSLWGAASLNGTAVTPFALTPVTVASGQVTAFTLSSALAGTANAAGFAGYAVASCNFQGGHGFAFITDGFGTTPGRGLSEGYLAPILSDIFNSASFAVPTQF
jgi:hypothetical protein